MLIHANKLIGSEIVSGDGPVGKVDDIFFDSVSWLCCWLVVNVDHWLPGRKVLLSFSTIRSTDEARREIHVPLTRDEIQKSPDVASRNPVSMEAELELGKYWMWTPPLVRHLPDDVARSIEEEATLPERAEAERNTHSHLQSVREVTGYRIEAPDGDVGVLEDLVADDGNWQIQYVVANTGGWLVKRETLIPRVSLGSIRWADRKVVVSLFRREIEGSPAHENVQAMGRMYEEALHSYYRKVPYWQAPYSAAHPHELSRHRRPDLKALERLHPVKAALPPPYLRR